LLPFADGTFDFVTCQTVLIHLSDPQLALAEMLRVLQPGGLLLCAEPDNFAVRWSQTSLSPSQSLDDEAAAFRFALAQHRGRIARGLGNLSLGGRLPAMFASAGVTGIQTHLSDKAISLYPPYDLPEQAAMNADTEQWYQSSADLTQETARESYLAGGGSPTDFEAHWSRELANRREYFDAIRRKEFDRAGGTLMYLVSGIKGHRK
jgi:SAM-dependent methyltransferase